MPRAMVCFGAALMLTCVAGGAGLHAEQQDATLAIVMTNDPDANQIQVYDAATHALLQTLPTQGRGGVAGNARGVRQLDDEIFAAVNNGSNTVAMFRRAGNALRFDELVATSSAPVSVEFGNGHMYVAGASTVDSFVLRNERIGWQDGSAVLALAEGGLPPAGSTAQIGLTDAGHLLVTLKTDPTPGTVDVIGLDDTGAVAGLDAVVGAPSGTLTPFGFASYGDGTAVITLAHSNQDGLFRDGAFVDVIAAGQAAPCWMTRAGKFVFTANTGSKTISRLVGTGSNIFIDDPVAAAIATNAAPSDIDTNAGVLGVLDHGAGRSHLSLFIYNQLGELTPLGSAIDLNVPNANGVAILGPRQPASV